MKTERAARHLTLLFLLFSSGWAANHFVGLLPVLRAQSEYPTGSVEIAFGLYALGLLPGLLGGGALADRVHPRALTLTGATVAAIGNLCILLGQSPMTTVGGRFIVGLGVGLAISAGTAWMGRLDPRGGATTAGTMLTIGFGLGPFVSGLIAQLVPGDEMLIMPLALTVVLSSIAVTLVATLRTAAPVGVTAPSAPPHETPEQRPGHEQYRAKDRSGAVGPALWRSLPMALWVFTGVSTVTVVLAGRVGVTGPLLAGVISLITFAIGALTQTLASRAGWGPRAGIVGALLAALGFALAALPGDSPGLSTLGVCSLVLGVSNGLCLRTGLLDLSTLAPPDRRGLVGGIFYVVTYFAFALPFVLEMVTPRLGDAPPFFALAGLALCTAALRAWQLRTR